MLILSWTCVMSWLIPLICWTSFLNSSGIRGSLSLSYFFLFNLKLVQGLNYWVLTNSRIYLWIILLTLIFYPNQVAFSNKNCLKQILLNLFTKGKHSDAFRNIWTIKLGLLIPQTIHSEFSLIGRHTRLVNGMVLISKFEMWNKEAHGW